MLVKSEHISIKLVWAWGELREFWIGFKIVYFRAVYCNVIDVGGVQIRWHDVMIFIEKNSIKFVTFWMNQHRRMMVFRKLDWSK